MADPMKIVVDVVNGEKVKELTAEIKRQEEAIAHWNSQMQGANSVQKAYLEGSMKQAAVAINGANAQLKEIPASATSAGRGLQQLSYAVDDVQYGFNAIVNNIPQIVMGLGGSVGLAGAIGIVAVAINQLIKHWAEVTALFEAGFSNQSYDQLVALKKAAEDAAESYDKLAKAKTEWEEKSTKGTDKLVENVGADKLRKAIASTLSGSAEGAEMTEQERRAAKSVEGADVGLQERVMARINKRLLEENAKEAEKIIGGLEAGGETGIKARSRLQHLMKINPEAFSPEMRAQLSQLEPGAIKKHEEQGTAGPYFTDDDDVGDKGTKRREETRKAQQEAEKANEERAAKTRKEIEKGAETEKAGRIRGLEEEKTRVQRAQKEYDDKMWQRTHEMTRGAVLSGGGKALVDLYQANARGVDDPKALAKQAHEQRMKTNKLLEKIEDQLKREQRVVIKT